MEKKIKKVCGKILDVDDNISIWADRMQYIVKINNHSTYHLSLEGCFQFIFEEEVKTRLIDNPKKNIERIIEIHKETAKWLKDIFKKVEAPFE